MRSGLNIDPALLESLGGEKPSLLPSAVQFRQDFNSAEDARGAKVELEKEGLRANQIKLFGNKCLRITIRNNEKVPEMLLGRSWLQTLVVEERAGSEENGRRVGLAVVYEMTGGYHRAGSSHPEQGSSATRMWYTHNRGNAYAAEATIDGDIVLRKIRAEIEDGKATLWLGTPEKTHISRSSEKPGLTRVFVFCAQNMNTREAPRTNRPQVHGHERGPREFKPNFRGGDWKGRDNGPRHGKPNEVIHGGNKGKKRDHRAKRN